MPQQALAHIQAATYQPPARELGSGHTSTCPVAAARTATHRNTILQLSSSYSTHKPARLSGSPNELLALGCNTITTTCLKSSALQRCPARNFKLLTQNPAATYGRLVCELSSRPWMCCTPSPGTGSLAPSRSFGMIRPARWASLELWRLELSTTLKRWLHENNHCTTTNKNTFLGSPQLRLSINTKKYQTVSRTTRSMTLPCRDSTDMRAVGSWPAVYGVA